MKVSLFHSSVPLISVVILWLMLSLALAGFTNTVIYQHTTSVKASAEELDARILGFVSDIHVTGGMVEVSMTSVITIGNDIGHITTYETRIEAE